MTLSLQSRRDYLAQIRNGYAKASFRKEKSRLLDEVTRVLGSHRKYVFQVPGGPERKPKRPGANDPSGIKGRPRHPNRLGSP
ncbi:hypothetical protein HYSC106933_11310 [Hydrogenibacillus schlegelii]